MGFIQRVELCRLECEAVEFGHLVFEQGNTFGVVLLSERLGPAGWAGCAVMLAGILCAEPAAAATLRRLARRPG